MKSCFHVLHFPGYDEPHTELTSADVEVTTDDRPLTIQYPIDRRIVRTVMAKNLRQERIGVEFQATITIANYSEEIAHVGLSYEVEGNFVNFMKRLARKR